MQEGEYRGEKPSVHSARLLLAKKLSEIKKNNKIRCVDVGGEGTSITSAIPVPRYFSHSSIDFLFRRNVIIQIHYPG